MALCSSSRPVLLATGSWIPTAPVVRYYTEIQALNDCCGSLLSCQATRRCSCWVCAMGSFETRLDTYSIFAISLVNRLYDASVVSLCRWALLALLLYGAPANRSPSPILLLLTSLSKSAALFVVAFLLTIDCEQLARRDESIGLINIMLIGHLTLKVILINELMLLLI